MREDPAHVGPPDLRLFLPTGRLDDLLTTYDFGLVESEEQCKIVSAQTEPVALLEQADGIFRDILANVTPDQMDLPTPNDEWDVPGLINHLVVGRYLGRSETSAPAMLRGQVGTALAIARRKRPTLNPRTTCLPPSECRERCNAP